MKTRDDENLARFLADLAHEFESVSETGALFLKPNIPANLPNQTILKALRQEKTAKDDIVLYHKPPAKSGKTSGMVLASSGFFFFVANKKTLSFRIDELAKFDISRDGVLLVNDVRAFDLGSLPHGKRRSLLVFFDSILAYLKSRPPKPGRSDFKVFYPGPDLETELLAKHRDLPDRMKNLRLKPDIPFGSFSPEFMNLLSRCPVNLTDILLAADDPGKKGKGVRRFFLTPDILVLENPVTGKVERLRASEIKTVRVFKTGSKSGTKDQVLRVNDELPLCVFPPEAQKEAEALEDFATSLYGAAGAPASNDPQREKSMNPLVVQKEFPPDAEVPKIRLEKFVGDFVLKQKRIFANVFRFFVFPDIDRRFLRDALKGFGAGANPYDVLALYDYSVKNKENDKFLCLVDGIRVESRLHGRTIRVDAKDILDLKTVPGGIVVNGLHRLVFNQTGETVENIKNLVSELVSLNTETHVPEIPGASEPASPKKSGRPGG
ncbi:MAG: hypothetical protein LBF41_04730 [Deltaproteobacteria bacterium]|jgi:hypothetical protein|nr:hypothetical protein [Deltaproteobacteria bacterium]